MRARRLLPVALLLLAACDRPPGQPPAAAGPASGGTVVLGVLGDVQNWNPYLCDSGLSEDLAALVYPSLAVEQPDYRLHPPSFAPALAESWEHSADGLSLTFRLRREARWSDGTPVTAEDVVYTFSAQTADEIGWPGVYDKENVERVEATDSHTVVFRFRRPSPYQLMDANEGLIVPAHAWREVPFVDWEDTDWSRRVLAAGPFRLARHSPQQEIVLEANPSYWRAGRPLVERVVVRVVPSPSGLVTQLLAGGVDFVDNLPARDVDRVRRNPRAAAVAYPDRSYAFVAWNNRHPLLADPRVRRALALAVDRQTLVDAVRAGLGRLAVGPILSGMWAFNDTLAPLPFDPAAARALLEQAGFVDRDGDGVRDRGGRPFELELLANSESQDRRDAAVLVQGDLARVGVRVRTRFLEHNAVLDLRDRGEFEALVSSWREPTQVDLRDTWHSAEEGVESNNFVRYSNPEVDALIERAEQATTFAEQKPLFDRIQELIVADQPYTFLYERDSVAGMSRRLAGVAVNDATPYFNLEDWSLAGE